MMNFTQDQFTRYHRHIILKDVGVEGQWKLSQANVLLIGAGGLGSPAALYLGAAGVGTIGIVDDDMVELSNLQRQILHATRDVNRPKVLSARETLNAINPDINVKTYQTRLDSTNIMHIIQKYDFVIDCSDNFRTKFLINDACIIARKPFSYGGVLCFSGQTMTILPGKSACYRCVCLEPPPPNPEQEGILGIVPGVLGTLQATEALKFILGIGELLTNRLLMFEAMNMEFRTIALTRNAACPVCGEHGQTTRELLQN